MRRFAFVIAILGMFVLVLLLNKSEIEVNNYEELEGLEINERVIVNGFVVSERYIFEEVLLTLDNNLELICECVGNFEGREINAVGVVEDYKGKKQIRVLEISTTK